MINNLRWEIFKLVRQSSTYYALLAIVIIEAFVMITAYYQGRYILDNLLDSLKESFIFHGDLLNGNLIIFIILNSLWFHIPLILMIVTSGLAANEFRDGTEQATLLQGVSRRTYITGKYLVAMLFALAILLFLAVSTICVSYLFFGRGDLVVYYETINIFESDQAFRRIIGAFISGANTLVFYSVISVTCAILVREPAKAWILSGLFLIVVTLLVKVDFGTLLNNIFFIKLIDSWQRFFEFNADIDAILMNNIVLLMYSLLFSFFGVLMYRKMEIE